MNITPQQLRIAGIVGIVFIGAFVWMGYQVYKVTDQMKLQGEYLGNVYNLKAPEMTVKVEGKDQVYSAWAVMNSRLNTLESKVYATPTPTPTPKK